MSENNYSRDVMQKKASAKYEEWMAFEDMDPELRLELSRMDEKEIYEAFYKDLVFGTGGLRGVIGAGTDRMNIFTVRKATQGFADYINENSSDPSVAIAFDSRIKSDLFSRTAAGVLAGNGIKVHIYDELMPTPALSFAVRHFKADAGIVITASHNPSKYNGYKAYNSQGCQMTLEAAEQVLDRVEKVDIFNGVQYIEFEEGLRSGMISYIGEEVKEAYLDAVQNESMSKEACIETPFGHCNGRLNVVYTPLNGAGNKCVRAILKRIGINKVTVVPEQEMPDGNFPTCPYPNPEKKEALAKGLALCAELAQKAKNPEDIPDLLVATDPDSDRVGIAVYSKGDYVLLTGNEVGVLLLDFICSTRTGGKKAMPEDPIMVKTIVTTKMTDAVAAAYGVEVINVLTGFKFIGEQIGFLEAKGQERRYIFGFEESYGYLSGSYVRDKDAVNGSMLICEMAAHYKQLGMTLADAIDKLYEKHGNYKDDLLDFAFEGAEGMSKMSGIMNRFRNKPPLAAAGVLITEISDYQSSERIRFDTEGQKTGSDLIDLPKSDVLEFILDDGSSFIIRPSGTEPKIKVYISAKGDTEKASREMVKKISDEISLKIVDAD